MTDTPEQPNVKIIKVRRVVAVSNDPKEYLLTPPNGYCPGTWRPERILRVPYGPLVLWRHKTTGMAECPACKGTGELEAWGSDDNCYDVECPKCDGEAEVEVDVDGDDVPDVWADSDGNVLEPELVFPDGRESQPTHRWIDQWVQAQQRA